MKLMSVCAFVIAMTPLSSSAAETPKLTPDVFAEIVGDDWTGNLTYLNYQEPFEDVTIRANIEISLIENGVELAYKYPDEPHANSNTRAKISKAGTHFMGAPITSNTVTGEGVREVTTRSSCEDMGRKAICEMVYTLSANQLGIRKMVTYDGDANAFQRNAYQFER